MDSDRIRRASEKLLKPYELPDDCPYLSEDQRELCKLTFEQRIEWMAEWLALAATIPGDEPDDLEHWDP